MNKEEKKIMQTTSARDYIKSLEQEGDSVFHGSSMELDVLEPRQAYVVHDESKEMVPHGKPGVSATQYADIAIFRALMNKENLRPRNFSTGFGLEGNIPFFDLNKETIEEFLSLKDSIRGYVYVFDKSEFEYFNPSELRTYQSIKPKEKVIVLAEDLPINLDSNHEGGRYKAKD